jgi:putative membrane-bound dehydrogenase-like protein
MGQLSFAGLLLAVKMLGASVPFREPFDTEITPGGPMSAATVVAQMKLPPGFRITAFAAEPEVRQPIAMATDSRGRLWVAENYTFSERNVGFNDQLRDRILMFEDRDNDGVFDRRTVFWDGAERLTSIEIGLGGVWAICLPSLVFIPDRNGDGIPDGPPEVVLDGFDHQAARHNVANGLRWGPDGWLYGRHGILAPSLLGAPGAAAADRVSMGPGIWRFHPLRKTVEIVAQGATNPWGMDWDAHGEAFFINTVIGHLWHVIPGAHYRRMFGSDPNPRVYELIEQHADHVHWASTERWTDAKKGLTDATSAAGGGHAHVGLHIYQGGQWPAPWANKLLTVNYHGRRVNVERLERAGSGYVGQHEPDQFQFPDEWFRGLDIIAAPDGGVFVSDWSDAGECHDVDGVKRTTGRIYKISYGPTTTAPPDLTMLNPAALARLQTSGNEWLVRQSRQALVDRRLAGGDFSAALPELARLAADQGNALHRLRALWTLQQLQPQSAEQLLAHLADADEHVRAWGIRWLADDRPAAGLRPTKPVQERLATLAAKDSSGLVRLALASLLQRVALAERLPVAKALLGRAEDADDHNLPLMLWYGVEPITAEGTALPELLAGARLPRVQRLGARRITELIDSAPEQLDALLTALLRAGSGPAWSAVLDGIADGTAGRPRAPQPRSWTQVAAKVATLGDAHLRWRAMELSGLFGEETALVAIQAMALDESASLAQRNTALQALTQFRAPGLRAVSEKLFRVRGLSTTAAAGLAVFEDPAIGDLMLTEWPRLDAKEKPAVMGWLVSRPAWARKVLEAVAAGRLRRDELSASQTRQIRLLEQPKLTAQLGALWGESRAQTSKEKAAALQKWKSRFQPDLLAPADPVHGRMLFRGVCGGCHKLNGEGGAIGPELTGSNRDNLDYLLENILFPNATVPAEYRQTTLTLKDGRVLAGVISAQTSTNVTLQAAGESLTIPLSNIEKNIGSNLSLMPEGLLDALGETDARDLIAYLMRK